MPASLTESAVDLLTGKELSGEITIPPYGVLVLKKSEYNFYRSVRFAYGLLAERYFCIVVYINYLCKLHEEKWILT